MVLICVGGTAGTGKTTLAKRLASARKTRLLNVKKLVRDEQIYDYYDKVDKSYVVDTKKLNKALSLIIKHNENMVIDSILAGYLDKRFVDICVITKCDLKKLESRLKKRKYSKAKIRENLDAEIFGVCLNDAKEAGHYTFVINTTKGINKESFSQLMDEVDEIEQRSSRAK